MTGKSPHALTLVPSKLPLRLVKSPERHERPRTRGACQWCLSCQEHRDSGKPISCGHSDYICRSRPCVFAGCRHHLLTDENRRGHLVINHEHADPLEMVSSCSLDEAERGGQSPAKVAEYFGVAEQAIKYAEGRAVMALRHRCGDELERLLLEYAEQRSRNRIVDTDEMADPGLWGVEDE